MNVKNFSKKLALSLCIASFSLTGTALAAESNVYSLEVPSKTVTVEEFTNRPYTQELDLSSNNIPVRSERYELKGVDQSGNITDKTAYKNSLLEFYNKNPEQNAEYIKNVDSFAAKVSSNAKTSNSITPMVLVGSGWSKKPVITSTQNYVTYSTSWLSEDNYRSSVPITATYTKSLKTKVSLGFSGDKVIKDMFDFSGSFEVEQTSTISQGAQIPGWVVWGTRPYINWTEERYKGEYYSIIHNGSYIETFYYEKTGVNAKLRNQSNEYWSRENTTKNTDAKTPSLPTGAPNV